ncbi:hypothetical protein L195_g058276 [Trifolium pratense]|uniref:Uncharacterized protein n=1 Tax=Trifolium pratense TaxID=57577 RepID=A0A2K3JRA5_TRIPR|nr:hypothetical protein L195_g058276 [Trifolium pratense]
MFYRVSDLSTDHPIMSVVAFTTGAASTSTRHDRAAATTGLIKILWTLEGKRRITASYIYIEDEI